MADAPVVDAPKLFKEIIPTELHERGWVKPFLDKPFTPELGVELSKKLDGAETLIGKKTLIPGADAKPEEVEAFYGKLRPEKVEDYDVKNLGEKPDEGLTKVLRAAAHKAGLDKRQFSEFLAGLAPDIAARQKAAAEASAAQDKEFEDIIAKTYAKDNEVVVKRVEAAITEHTPEPLKPFVAGLDNKALAVLTGVINAVLVKYASEDDLKGKNNNLPNNSGDKAALQAEARKLMAEKAYSDFQHPDHASTVARVNEIYSNPVFKQ